MRWLHKRLKSTATKFLQSPAKTTKEYLIVARENHDAAEEVFPKAGFGANMYNVFLYESIFYAQQSPVEEILPELVKGDAIPFEMRIQIVELNLISEELDEQATQLGLSYWNEYKEYLLIKQNVPDKKTMRLLDRSEENWLDIYPTQLLVEEAYLVSLELVNAKKPYTRIDVIILHKRKWLNIIVYLTVEESFNMLRKSVRTDIASLVRTMLNFRLKGNRQVTDCIDIRDSYGTYLPCSGLGWRLVWVELEDDEMEEPIETHNLYQLDTFYDFLLG